MRIECCAMERPASPSSATSLAGLPRSRLLSLAASAAFAGLLVACADDSVEEPAATPDPTVAQPAVDPVDCYTPSDGAPGPADTNRYAIVLIEDPGAHAGALDEYMHCAGLPVVNPASATDCYSTSADNPQHLRGVNQFAIAELSGTADAGDLDRYEHCKYLPVAQPTAN